MAVDLDHHHGLLIAEARCNVEACLVAVDGDDEWARARNRLIVMCRGEDDAVDRARQPVEIEIENRIVRGGHHLDRAFRRFRVRKENDIAVVANLLGAIETEGCDIDPIEAEIDFDSAARADAEIGQSALFTLLHLHRELQF